MPESSTASERPVATKAPTSRARSSALAREYAARLRALLAAVDTVEEAALERVLDGLRELREALVRAATGGRAHAVAGTLDPSHVIAQIDAAIRAFQSHATGALLAAQLEAITAGALTVDGVLRPALERARAEASAEVRRKAAPATGRVQGRAPARAEDRRTEDAPGEAPSSDAFHGDLSARGPGTGAGTGGGRLPPVSVAPPSSMPGGPNLPKISIAGAYPVIPNGLVRAAADLAAEEVTTLTTKMRQEMASAVRRAALGGLTPLEVMREVDRQLPADKRGAVLTQGVGSSAERIVRTQMARVFSKAADARAKELADGMRGAGGGAKVATVLRKQWIATLDTRTRPEHLAAHGQTVGVDEDFTVAGERIAFPGDPRASAGNVINCRCRVVTVLPDNPEDLFAR